MRVRLGRRVFGEDELTAMARVGPLPDAAAVHLAVEQATAAGAEIVDLFEGMGDQPAHRTSHVVAHLVAAVRSREPGLVIGVTTRHRGVAEAAANAGADLLDTGSGQASPWLAEVAAAAGIGLVVGSIGAAERAVDVGVRPDGILVRAPTGDAAGDAAGERTSRFCKITSKGVAGLPELAAAGWPVLVELPDEGDEEPGGTVDAVATASLCAWLGARMFATRRVRDTRQALDMVASIRGTRQPAVSRRGLA